MISMRDIFSSKKQAENVSNANYTFITEMYSSKEESDKTVIEHYHKDGIILME